MTIHKNISLKSYNSFNVDVSADYFVSINNEEDIIDLIETDIFQKNNYFILGGGSNVLFVEDYKGLIINVEIKGIHIRKSEDDYVVLEVGAGENWDGFIRTCVKSNYYGLENLALIPGKVGAAPVQNIGAYGIEQQDCFVSLRGVNLKTKEIIELNYEQSNFGYRSSIFKKELANNFIITSVQYKLSRKKTFNLSYKELENEVYKFQVSDIDLQYIYDTICRLRKSKLPTGDSIGSAGSFFKNPIVNKSEYFKLKNEFPEIKGYLTDVNDYKLSAGWLIEQCGWKGKRFGDAAVFDKHALVLVNLGNASGKDILNLAKNIQSSVNDKFGIRLEPEVIIIENKK